MNMEHAPIEKGELNRAQIERLQNRHMRILESADPEENARAETLVLQAAAVRHYGSSRMDSINAEYEALVMEVSDRERTSLEAVQGMAANLMQYEGGYREEFARLNTAPGDVQDITLKNLQYPMGYELLARLCSFGSVEELLSHDVSMKPEEEAQEEPPAEQSSEASAWDVYSSSSTGNEVDTGTGYSPFSEEVSSESSTAVPTWPAYETAATPEPSPVVEEVPDEYQSAADEYLLSALSHVAENPFEDEEGHPSEEDEEGHPSEVDHSL